MAVASQAYPQCSEQINARTREILDFPSGRSGAPRSSRSAIDLRTPGQIWWGKFIRNPIFETTMAVIILLNLGMIITEANQTAQRPGGENPDAAVWLQVSSWVTLFIFVLELILRIYVDRLTFFDDGWNSFDCLVIIIDSVCSVLGLIVGSAIPVSALRILRLCKLARVTKIFRIFPELRLMMAGLVGSMRSIFWGMVLLIFALCVWAIIGVQFIHPLNLDIAETGLYTRGGCERCPRAYTSVSAAMITLIQQSVSGDSWGLMTIPIIDTYPVAMIYFLGVMMTITLAVMNLILGVVVNVAMQSRDDLAEQMAKEKILNRVDAEKHLTTVCAAMDSDESGQLSKQELLTGYQENAQFRDTLYELGIFEDDLEILWTMLDPDRDGQVPYTTFIHKSYSMKESDTQFMLAYIKYYVTCIRDQMNESHTHLRHELTSALFATRDGRPFAQGEDNVPPWTDVVGPDVPRENAKVDIVSEGAQASGSMPLVGGTGVSLRLSEDDRKFLDDVLQKSWKCRQELDISITNFTRRLDALVREAVGTEGAPRQGSTRATPGTRTLSQQGASPIWCCQPETDSSNNVPRAGSISAADEEVLQNVETESNLNSGRGQLAAVSRIPQGDLTKV